MDGILMCLLLAGWAQLTAERPSLVENERLEGARWQAESVIENGSMSAPDALMKVSLLTMQPEAGPEGEVSTEQSDANLEGSFQTLSLNAVFRDGFELRSHDGQRRLSIRALSQIDGKLFTPSGQEPTRDGLYIPRFRIYFEGQLSPLIEYELSLQRSVEGAFDILDANVNFAVSDSFQVQVGTGISHNRRV